MIKKEVEIVDSSEEESEWEEWTEEEVTDSEAESEHEEDIAQVKLLDFQ